MSTSATNPHDSNNSQGLDGIITIQVCKINISANSKLLFFYLTHFNNELQPLSKNQMQPSYAAEYPIADNLHTFYGGMLNGLGNCFGFIGSVSFTII